MSKQRGQALTMIRARARWNPAGCRATENRKAISEYDLPDNVISLNRRMRMSVLDEFDIDDPIASEPTDAELRELQILIDSGQIDEMDLGDEYEASIDLYGDDYAYPEDLEFA